MADFTKPIYRDAGKPDAAVPVTNGCAFTGAAIQGDEQPSPIQIQTTMPSHWRDQADGFYE